MSQEPNSSELDEFNSSGVEAIKEHSADSYKLFIYLPDDHPIRQEVTQILEDKYETRKECMDHRNEIIEDVVHRWLDSSNLSLRQAAVFVMNEHPGTTQEEIGDMLDISRGTVADKLSREIKTNVEKARRTIEFVDSVRRGWHPDLPDTVEVNGTEYDVVREVTQDGEEHLIVDTPVGERPIFECDACGKKGVSGFDSDIVTDISKESPEGRRIDWGLEYDTVDLCRGCLGSAEMCAHCGTLAPGDQMEDVDGTSVAVLDADQGEPICADCWSEATADLDELFHGKQ